MCCAVGVVRLVVAVVLWQSAEQRRGEVEAADAASMARLVRGVYCCRAVAVLVLAKCMLLLWRWRGQAGAGLGALRSPAVRKLLALLCWCTFWDVLRLCSTWAVFQVLERDDNVCEVSCAELSL